VGELASNGARFDFHGDLVLSVNGVEVRQPMLVEEHPDDDAEKP
jgi:hypothetical protein